MSDKIIKSNARVKAHGEVFTPKKIVRKMTSFSGMNEKIKDIRSTVLEPSAGEGAFLLPILETKLMSAFRLSNDYYHFNRYALIALSSVYGIELLDDNVSMLILRMEKVFRDYYVHYMDYLSGDISEDVLLSANTIINANIVQGNALTGFNSNKQKVIMSEWKPTSKFRVKRKCFYYKSAVEQTDSRKQLDLFTKQTDANNPFPDYLPVDIVNVHNQLIVSQEESANE